MLNLATDGRLRTCDGIDRREFMQVGALGLGGLTLPQLLAATTAGAETGRALKDTSIVLLFMTGGPSQIETFDPKMTAPSDIRSVTGEVATRIPGITFGGTFPQLAARADRMSVVRSFTHGNSNHTGGAQDVMRGGSPIKVGMGSLMSRVAGSTHPKTGMPSHVYLAHKEEDPQFNKERLRLLEAGGPGSLGTAYGPFEAFGDGQANRNMTLIVPRSRLDDRRRLRRALDRLHRRIDSTGSMSGLDKFEQQAFDLILGKSKNAFDLSQEDAKLVARYDTSRFNTALRIERRQSTLGHQLLLARRLCEVGCRFITIHNPGWDMHGGNTQFSMPGGMERLGRPVDQAVSAFLDDVADRGLSDKILLILTGEFGRTPKVKSNAGRDHWPRLSTLAFAGGGLRMGQTIGQSNSHAEAPQSNPVGLEDLLATVMHSLFDVTELRLRPNIPREVMSTIERGEPIDGLF